MSAIYRRLRRGKVGRAGAPDDEAVCASICLVIDDDFDFARDRWLRNLKLMHVFRAGTHGEGLALVDRWLDAALPLLADAGEPRQATRDLFVPVRPGTGDVRALTVAPGRTFADAGAERLEVAGGACYASNPHVDGRTPVEFTVTATAADPRSPWTLGSTPSSARGRWTLLRDERS